MISDPYGGTLVDRFIEESALREKIASAQTIPVKPIHNDLINLENMAVGGYSPLEGFMVEDEYFSVIYARRLPNDLDWAIPILFHVDGGIAEEDLRKAGYITFVDGDGKAFGALEIASIFRIDRQLYCSKVFGTASEEHPGVRKINQASDLCVGGPVWLVPHKSPDYIHAHTPRELREILSRTGRKSHIAFSTRNICHWGHEYLHTLALELFDVLGIHVITGPEYKGGIRPEMVFKTYTHLIDNYYPEGKVLLNNLRLPTLLAGPREAFLQATMMQNFGFTHFMVGRDHAGIGQFYSKYASQEIFDNLTDLSIEIVPVSEQRFCLVCNKINTANSCRHKDAKVRHFNGRDIRRLIREKRFLDLDDLIRPDIRDLVVELWEEYVHPIDDDPDSTGEDKLFFK